MKVWKTKEGVEIPIKDMTNRHILNAIKYLEKYENHMRWHLIEQCDTMLNSINGEMARNMIEDQIDSLIENNPESPDLFEDYCPIYYDLIEEARKRGLV